MINEPVWVTLCSARIAAEVHAGFALYPDNVRVRRRSVDLPVDRGGGDLAGIGFPGRLRTVHRSR
jgi:hypothetical protein